MALQDKSEFREKLMDKEEYIVVKPMAPEGTVTVAPEGTVIVEQKTQADATSDKVTFSAAIKAIEIYHAENTAQEFVVNGLTLKIPAGGYRTRIGGTPSAEVTLPASVTCILNRLE